MTTATPFAALAGQQYANLTTYRKSGEAMITPIWFAQVGETLYFYTQANAGKIKRIRNNSRVEIGPSDRGGKPLGPSVSATARILPQADWQKADQALNAKYGLIKRAFSFVSRLRGIEPAYVALEPAK